METKPKFGPEKNGFDREELNKSLIGKVVLIYGASSNICIKGILKHYIEHDLAILEPYLIYNVDNQPKIINNLTKVDNPVIISISNYKTLEEYIEKHQENKTQIIIP